MNSSVLTSGLAAAGADAAVTTSTHWSHGQPVEGDSLMDVQSGRLPICLDDHAVFLNADQPRTIAINARLRISGIDPDKRAPVAVGSSDHGPGRQRPLQCLRN